MDIPPNQTIYVNNLYEKLTKEELKKCLYAMFSQFGRIMDVVCMKTFRLRGQAWVVFTDAAAAGNAMRTMQGFPFFDKPIRITFAKTKSDAVAKVQGTYNADKKQRAQKNAAARDAAIKKAAGIRGPPTAAAPVAAAPMMPAAAAASQPNKILFVQNLPENTNDQMLAMLFQQFPGFKEVRMVDARPGIAFVEFDADMQSSAAMANLQGFKITPTNAMLISYAKQ